MDKLRGMETFIAVVECGSFTGAASRLVLPWWSAAALPGRRRAWGCRR